MRVVITGGSGFVGSNLISNLRNSGIDVRNLDVRPSPWHNDITIRRDITKSLEVAEIGDCDSIVHLAAVHRDDVTPKSLYHDVNVTGTENVVAFAEKRNVKKIVFFSSVAVYGFAEPGAGEDAETRPFNEYGSTKLQAETILKDWSAKSLDRSLTIIRPTVIFGPRNRGNVFNLMNQIWKKRFLKVGSGENVKSLAYIDNVVGFATFALKLEKTGVRTFNYVDAPELKVNDMVDLMAATMGKPLSRIRVPMLLAKTGAAVFDLLSIITGRKFPISRIRIKKFAAETSFSSAVRATGYLPKKSVREGILETIDYEFLKMPEDNVVFDTE